MTVVAQGSRIAVALAIVVSSSIVGPTSDAEAAPKDSSATSMGHSKQRARRRSHPPRPREAAPREAVQRADGHEVLVESDPIGAMVYFGTKELGLTPTRVRVPSDELVILTFVRPGYLPHSAAAPSVARRMRVRLSPALEPPPRAPVRCDFPAPCTDRWQW